MIGLVTGVEAEIEVTDSACRRIVAALLLQCLKDVIGGDPVAACDAQSFINAPIAFELARAIDLPWPPTAAMLSRFATDPKLCLPAFIMADA